MSNYRSNPNYCRNTSYPTSNYRTTLENSYEYTRTSDDLSNFPIAMAYVPFQKWEQPFEPEVGLNKGTIFPQLFKPFLGSGGCR